MTWAFCQSMVYKFKIIQRCAACTIFDLLFLYNHAETSQILEKIL